MNHKVYNQEQEDVYYLEFINVSPRCDLLIFILCFKKKYNSKKNKVYNLKTLLKKLRTLI